MTRNSFVLLCALVSLWSRALVGCATPQVEERMPVTVVPQFQSMSPLWSRPARSVLALSDGFVLMADRGIVCAEGATGEIRWRAPAAVGEHLQAGESEGTIVLYEPAAGLRSFDRETGRELFSRKVQASEANFSLKGGRVYLWTSDWAAAYDPRSLQHAWEWEYGDHFEILGLLADEGRVAIDVRAQSTTQDEAYDLDFATGFVAQRYLGYAIGFHGSDLYVKKGLEVWVWRAGKFVAAHRLNGYEGGQILLHRGEIVYEAVNRYFAGERARVTSKGVSDAPQQVEEVRELVRGVKPSGGWHVPLDGKVSLFGGVIVEEYSGGLRARRAIDASPLWEIQGRVKDYSTDGRLLYIVTLDGTVTAYRLM